MVDISVIMPVYNAGRYLEEAVQSILNQRGVAFEMIVIDDCSTDGSSEVLDRLAVGDGRIVLLRQAQNSGHAAGVNAAMAAVQAPLVAHMHADDVALPGRLEAQHRLLSDQPDIDIAGTWLSCIDIHGNPSELGLYRHPTNPANIAWNMHFECCLGHPTVAGRTQVFRDNPYDAGFHGAEDYELWTRLLFRHRITNVPRILLHYRIHEAQVSQRHSRRLNNEAISARRRAIQALSGRETSIATSELLANAAGNTTPLSVDTFTEAGETLTLMLENYLKCLSPKSNVARAVHDFHSRLAALAMTTDAPTSVTKDVWFAFMSRALQAADDFRASASA